MQRGVYPFYVEVESTELGKGVRGAQEDIYEEVAPLVDWCMQGFNACVMAYGQATSGKTYTMIGTSDSPGGPPDQLPPLQDAPNLLCNAQTVASVSPLRATAGQVHASLARLNTSS